MNSHFNAVLVSITATMLLGLALLLPTSSSVEYHKTIPQDQFSSYHGSKMPELQYYDYYENLHPSDKSVVVYPIFTQSAYEWKGFHDFYAGYCDDCLTTKIHDQYQRSIASSGNGFRILEFLGYEVIDDIDLDKNPDILTKYDRVILLHNEFVTQKEFDAIVQHPNVIFLYPNALSSKVSADYSTNTIKLIRGPGYPESNIKNGFDWENNNSQYLYNWDCLNWKFYEIENGYMLNCYPETFLPLYGYEILKTIKTLR